ncbi:hypothetical protein CR513_19582, partial [Mucuna pruriens]
MINLIHLEYDVPNNEGYVAKDPIVSKTKVQPKESRPKGGVEDDKRLEKGFLKWSELDKRNEKINAQSDIFIFEL